MGDQAIWLATLLFAATFGITLAFGFLMLWQRWEFERKYNELKLSNVRLQEQVQALTNIMAAHFPVLPGVSVQVGGSAGDVQAAGRDGRR